MPSPELNPDDVVPRYVRVPFEVGDILEAAGMQNLIEKTIACNGLERISEAAVSQVEGLRAPLEKDISGIPVLCAEGCSMNVTIPNADSGEAQGLDMWFTCNITDVVGEDEVNAKRMKCMGEQLRAFGEIKEVLERLEETGAP